MTAISKKVTDRLSYLFFDLPDRLPGGLGL